MLLSITKMLVMLRKHLTVVQNVYVVSTLLSSLPKPVHKIKEAAEKKKNEEEE